MSDRILGIIGEIRMKAVEIHQQRRVEQSKNEALGEEVRRLQEKLADDGERISSLSSKVSSLEKELKAAKDHDGVNMTKGAVLSDGDIDDMVREIEYCIKRLKQ